MPEIELGGCAPEPLQSYGKALGVLRIVAEQCDPMARAWWRGDAFVLRSQVGEQGLRRFFLDRYRPTPLISPWNLDSGFFGGRQNLRRLAAHPDPRLNGFRAAVEAARTVLHDLGLGPNVAKPALKNRLKATKPRLIARLRARLPEEATRWLDATAVLTGGNVAFPPLFGAGGTDGRFELSDGFMGALIKIFEDPGRRPDALEGALFGTPQPALEGITPGLFAPGGVGGPNSLEGFEGGGGANPWDVVLAFEGLLLLAGSTARRYGSQTEVRAAFPFILRTTVAAGYPTAAEEDARGEVWLPLWDRPASLAEIRYVFREGRAEWSGRPASTAVDVARALVSLGVDRGLTEFRRYGIQKRSGRSYLASPLGRFRVAWRPNALLLAEVDEFLGRLQDLRRARETPTSFLRLLRRLDDAILAYCAEGARERLLDVLVAVAQIDRALGLRPALRSRGRIQPATPVSARWIPATRDASPEYSIAAAIASLQAGNDGLPGVMRQHIVPVERRGLTWRWLEGNGHGVVWTGRDPVADLVRVVDRRIVEAVRAGTPDPFRGAWLATGHDVAAFLRGEVDFGRLGRLVEALSLVQWWSGRREGTEPKVGRDGEVVSIPLTFALIKLTAMGDPSVFAPLGARDAPRLDPTTVALLKAGDVWEAARRAARRLRAVGLTPVGWERLAAEGRAVRPDVALGRRFAAALAVPVAPEPLLHLVLATEPPEHSLESGIA